VPGDRQRDRAGDLRVPAIGARPRGKLRVPGNRQRDRAESPAMHESQY